MVFVAKQVFALFCKKNYLLNFGLPEFLDFFQVWVLCWQLFPKYGGRSQGAKIFTRVWMFCCSESVQNFNIFYFVYLSWGSSCVFRLRTRQCNTYRLDTKSVSGEAVGWRSACHAGKAFIVTVRNGEGGKLRVGEYMGRGQKRQISVHFSDMKVRAKAILKLETQPFCPWYHDYCKGKLP